MLSSSPQGAGMAAGGMAGMGIGDLLSRLFGNYTNPADAGMKYLNQMPGMLSPYMKPYMDFGQQAGGALQGQYDKLLSDPGGMINKMGESYHQSPGFQFALQQALQGANQGAAAGGMAGSPQGQQQNMGIATGMANQDYNSWLDKAMGMYGQGLSGEQGMYNTGFNASKSMMDQIAQMLAAQSQMAYEGQNAQNQRNNGWFGSLGTGLGALAGYFL